MHLNVDIHLFSWDVIDSICYKRWCCWLRCYCFYRDDSLSDTSALYELGHEWRRVYFGPLWPLDTAFNPFNDSMLVMAFANHVGESSSNCWWVTHELGPLPCLQSAGVLNHLCFGLEPVGRRTASTRDHLGLVNLFYSRYICIYIYTYIQVYIYIYCQ